MHKFRCGKNNKWLLVGKSVNVSYIEGMQQVCSEKMSFVPNFAHICGTGRDPNQWFTTWSRWTTDGPWLFYSGLRLNLPPVHWPMRNTLLTSCSRRVSVAKWSIWYFLKRWSVGQKCLRFTDLNLFLKKQVGVRHRPKLGEISFLAIFFLWTFWRIFLERWAQERKKVIDVYARTRRLRKQHRVYFFW